MAAIERKRARRSSAAHYVTFRTAEKVICKIPFSKQLQRLAVQWNYIVHQHSRWLSNAKAHQDVAKRATEALRELGVRTEHLKAMARAGVLEVGVPFKSE